MVGSKRTGAILTLQSSEVHSVGGYHHEFADIGYRFNFEDLSSVPTYAYYMGTDMVGPYYGSGVTDRYRYGTDFINGINTLDFGGQYGSVMSESWIWDEAYAPKVLMPLQIRSLDPAW